MGMLAPLFADNDCSTGATYYHQYANKRTSSPTEKARVAAILERAKQDVNKYSGESIVPTWALVVTWKDMLPRLNYDATKDNVS